MTRTAALILSIFLAAGGCAPVYAISNFHVVNPDVMRGAQPSERGLWALKDYYNVKTILSLRRDGLHNKWEKRVANRLGMDFINIPMSGGREQSAEKIQMCLGIISDKSKQPIFVHCRAGKDRTGLVFAAYRVAHDHWSIEDAYKEMHAYGYSESVYYNLKKSLFRWHAHLKNKIIDRYTQAPNYTDQRRRDVTLIKK